MHLRTAPTLLLAPAGVVVSHAFASSTAHSWTHGTPAFSVGGALATVALPLALAAIAVVLLGPRDQVQQTLTRGLILAQAVLFLTTEALEALTGFDVLSASAHEPTVWASLLAQVVTAAVIGRTIAVLETRAPRIVAPRRPRPWRAPILRSAPAVAATLRSHLRAGAHLGRAPPPPAACHIARS